MTQVPVSKRLVMWIAGITLLVYVGYGVGVLLIGNLTASGNFGDAFGAISGLLSGAGFIAAVIALVLQHNELQETKKEVQATLEAQKKQADEAARAADAHEQNVHATHLLARVQGFAALLAYYDGLRSADLAVLNSLERELRDLKSNDLFRRNQIHSETQEIRKNFGHLNEAALRYEKDLSAVLRESGHIPFSKRPRDS